MPVDLICCIFIEYSIRLVQNNLLIKGWPIAVSLINARQYDTTYFGKEECYMLRLKQIAVIRPQLQEEKYGGFCNLISVFMSLHIRN